ncbi:hypothetical protein AAFF_G00206050 [Aldrovandia affinis]|uniref:Uncharacterized protein n=1 Tax=Aldrovandia affinis TaxID=143900 RepID=A0AAD7RI55_9TELE|nr:hypothetical protein AAFF_G00206050 [Aldrovandia affinis]
MWDVLLYQCSERCGMCCTLDGGHGEGQGTPTPAHGQQHRTIHQRPSRLSPNQLRPHPHGGGRRPGLRSQVQRKRGIAETKDVVCHHVMGFSSTPFSCKTVKPST